MADQEHPAKPQGAAPRGEEAATHGDASPAGLQEQAEVESTANGEPPRRQFLATASGLAMLASLGTAYGTLGVMMGRFVYPAGGSNQNWLFVATVDQLAPGDSLEFTAPSGAKIVVARQGDGQQAEDFLALSSVCPHLGCRVHWESAHERFFCPCHNGAFDRQGTATEGPPLAARQSLLRYPLKVEGGLLYVLGPVTAVVRADPESGPPAEAGPGAFDAGVA